ncbi:MAG: Gfo/Idh/MocA family oxidoreductase [Lentisphaeria bacterium]|nr:Gfo/Idh/MocA family oxidoreductase [Lentisphaeria bacterium]
MEKVRIAQVGVTHEHAPGKIVSLKKLTDFYEIAGYVNDLSFNSLPEYYSDHFPSFYEGLRELSMDEVLNDPALQAVTVEVPNNELVSMAMKFAERGIAMHMDKPAGLDLELYGKLLDICKAKNLPFQMGFMFRGNPAFQFCIRAIREKLIGDVITIEADMNHGYGGEEYQKYISQFSGGLMYNLGCHLIDFITAAMGRPENVTGFLRSAPGDPAHIKNNCMAVLEYPNAYAVVSSCSRQHNTSAVRTIHIVGTQGSIIFSPIEAFAPNAVEMKIHVVKNSPGLPAGTHTLTFPIQTDRYTEQLIELAQVIRGEKEATYSYEHDYLVHEVTLAAAGYTDWKTK